MITTTVKLNLHVKYLIEAAKTGLKLSVPEAAALIVDEAKLNAPVVTGTLRDNIHQETVEETDTRMVVAACGATAADNEYGIFPPYARRIEYGFVGVDSLGRHYNQAAQPYFRPAVDAKSQEAVQTIKEGIYAALDDAMNQNARRRNG